MNWKYILIVFILAAVVGGGILAYQYWWTPKEEGRVSEEVPSEKEIEVPEEVKPPEEIVKDETLNWKLLKSPIAGFQFKYPPEWFAFGEEEMDPGYVFIADSPEASRTKEITFKISFYDEVNTIDEFIARAAEGIIISEEPMIIGGISGVKFVTAPPFAPEIQEIVAVFPLNQINSPLLEEWREKIKGATFFLVIRATPRTAEAAKTAELEKVFNKVFPTFRFLE